MNNVEYITEYVASLAGLRKRERGEMRARLTKGISYFEDREIIAPREADYQELKTAMKGKKESKAKIEADIRAFYSWLAAKEDTSMQEEITPEQGAEQVERSGEIEAEADTSETVEAVQSEELHEVEEGEAPKRGRKPKAEGERKDKKISVYMTVEVYEAFDELAHYKGEDVSVLASGLVEGFVKANAEALQKIRDFKSKVIIK